MRAKRDYLSSGRGSFIISLIVVISALFVLTGCLSLPYGNPADPGSSGRTGHRQSPGTVYYMDQTSAIRGGGFTIRNERGQVVFSIRGNFFSRSRRISLLDHRGRELFYITKTVSGPRNRYRIYSYGKLRAKVYKSRTSSYEKFYINAKRGKDYTVRGDFRNRLYSFYYKGRQIASISKRRRPYSDKYRIEISPFQDNLIILAASVIIDMDNSFRRR